MKFLMEDELLSQVDIEESLHNDNIEQHKKLSKEIGLKTLGDLKTFKDHQGSAELDALKDYKKELDLDKAESEDSLQESSKIIVANIYDKSGNIIETRHFSSRKQLDNYVDSLNNLIDMTADNNVLYKDSNGNIAIQTVWKITVDDLMTEDAKKKKELDLDEALGLEEGISKNMTAEDIAKKHNVSVDDIKAQLEKGIKVEKEHTDDESKAERIALDHLFEIPNYYDKLDKMEKSALLNLQDDEISESIEDKDEISKLADELNDAFEADNSYYDIYPYNGKLECTIERGDWKHDHLYFEHFVRNFLENKGYVVDIDKDILGESDDDSYSATYTITVTRDDLSKDQLSKETQSDRLDESINDEKIELYYDDLTITDYGEIRDDNWYELPYYPDEREITIEYVYEIDKEYVIDELVDYLLDDESINLEGDELEKYVYDNFDDLFTKYEDKLLNHFESWAREEAEERYQLDEKLIQGKSDATLKKNIATEIKAGKDPKQAYAIAKSIQNKHLNEGKADIYNEIENEYFQALNKAEENGLITYIVAKDTEDEEEFDSFEEAKKYAQQLNLQEIYVKGFAECYGYYCDGDYVEYPDHILNLNKEIVEQLAKTQCPEDQAKIKEKIENIEKEIDYADDHNNPGKVVDLQHEISLLREDNDDLDGLEDFAQKAMKENIKSLDIKIAIDNETAESNVPVNAEQLLNDINEIEDEDFIEYTNENITEN